ncbi:hypothetical protein TWF696_001874 [Orbilia brochopaga]|uniref:Uncharacterized protein n=1 Tax=Orbilia brochopaga TaxID=3140254 RepID=A0AAV9U675_9PEZI
MAASCGFQATLFTRLNHPLKLLRLDPGFRLLSPRTRPEVFPQGSLYRFEVAIPYRPDAIILYEVDLPPFEYDIKSKVFLRLRIESQPIVDAIFAPEGLYDSNGAPCNLFALTRTPQNQNQDNSDGKLLMALEHRKLPGREVPQVARVSTPRSVPGPTMINSPGRPQYRRGSPTNLSYSFTVWNRATVVEYEDESYTGGARGSPFPVAVNLSNGENTVLDLDIDVPEYSSALLASRFTYMVMTTVVSQ